ncbi:MAG TPA: hypothetical protein VGA20_04260 [Gemmatimonadales bacterium]
MAIDERVIERQEQVGRRLTSLRDAIDRLIARGQMETSDWRVADVSGRRTITARWTVEECWADGCELEAVRAIGYPDDPTGGDGPFCATHDWSDIDDAVAATA